jgi:hypothetical protein
MGLALPHPEQAPLDALERRGLQIDQDTQQPIRRRRERTVLVGREPSGRARLPIEAPAGHLSLEGGLKGRDQRLKLVYGETGQLEDLRGTALEIGKPSRAHGGSLLFLEAQYTTTRDEL